MPRRPNFINPFRQQRHPVAEALQQIPGLVLQIQQQKAQQQQREEYIARQEERQQQQMDQQMQLRTLDAISNLSRNANPAELKQLNQLVTQYQDNPYAQVVSAQLQGEQKATQEFQNTIQSLDSLEGRLSEISQGTPDPQQSGEILQALEKMAVTKKNLRSDQMQMVRDRAKNLIKRAEVVDRAFRPLQGMDVDPETRDLQFGEGTSEPVRKQAQLLKQRIERGNFVGAKEAFNTLMRLESKLAMTTPQELAQEETLGMGRFVDDLDRFVDAYPNAADNPEEVQEALQDYTPDTKQQQRMVQMIVNTQKARQAEDRDEVVKHFQKIFDPSSAQQFSLGNIWQQGKSLGVPAKDRITVMRQNQGEDYDPKGLVRQIAEVEGQSLADFVASMGVEKRGIMSKLPLVGTDGLDTEDYETVLEQIQERGVVPQGPETPIEIPAQYQGFRR